MNSDFAVKSQRWLISNLAMLSCVMENAAITFKERCAPDRLEADETVRHRKR